LGDEILELPYYYFRETEVDGIPVVVTRTGWTSEVGYEIYLCDPSRGTDLWELILEMGEPYQIRPTGPSDIRRIEGGIFNWGADMTYGDNPFELGLDRLVDLEVPCVAREALNRIAAEGVARRMVGVELDGDRFPILNYTKWPVHVDGSHVGRITSAVYSPRLEKNIGYAWVPAELAEPRSELHVESEWGKRSAKVVPLPFWDPGKTIPVA
jgi:aminomethyltransferase